MCRFGQRKSTPKCSNLGARQHTRPRPLSVGCSLRWKSYNSWAMRFRFSALASGGVHGVSAVLVEKVFGVLSGLSLRPACSPEHDFGRAFSLQDVVPHFSAYKTTINEDVGVHVSERDALRTHRASFRDQFQLANRHLTPR